MPALHGLTFVTDAIFNLVGFTISREILDDLHICTYEVGVKLCQI